MDLDHLNRIIQTEEDQGLEMGRETRQRVQSLVIRDEDQIPTRRSSENEGMEPYRSYQSERDPQVTPPQ